MSAFATLTLLDSAAANVAFNPVTIDPSGVAVWKTADSVYDAKSTVSMSVSHPKTNGSQVVRVKQKVVLPIMDSVDASLKLADAIVNIDIVLPKRASETNRLDVLKYAEKLLANAITVDAVQNLQGIY